MSYVKNDFLLTTPTAKKLYLDYARDMPIFDYHCHLPEKQILENAPFSNIYEIWLAGDHYKWRLMRNYGVDERYITGNATAREKFIAYCRTLATAFGNPLYHWSQVELSEFFGCDLEINEKNAEKIWAHCNAYILENNVTPQSLIEGANVKIIFTTNEVFDDLSTFERIAEQGYGFRVIPAFRGDKIMNVEAPGYKGFLKKLEEKTFPVTCISELEAALAARLDEFKRVGCVAADISLERIYPISSSADADRVLKAALSGEEITARDAEVFKGYLTYYLMKLYAANDIRTELHIGPMRNNNSVMMESIGADTGFDSISDENSIKTMSRLFDTLNSEGFLPKTIVFNLNPKLNAEIMSLIGCFQSPEARGKLQFGPAWWFLDNKVGMERHLRDLTATGHIATFVGMLTDSRSLLSYPRHHYFRRILCDYLGGMMERGEMTADIEAVGRVVRDISYNNSVSYFGMEGADRPKKKKNVLFIGNSYTFYSDMPSLFARIAESAGYKASVRSITRGGEKLSHHGEPDGETHRRIKELCAEMTFDCAVLQEQSTRPALQPELLFEGGKSVAALLSGRVNELVLYATWARREDSSFLAENSITAAEMTDRIEASYTELAEILGARTARVGRAFERCQSNDLHASDASHPSYLGSCLAALVLFKTVFEVSDEEISALPTICELSESDSRLIKKAAIGMN